MSPETRVCQNCKNELVLEPDDLAFLENLKLPRPTWCPRCQLQRRLAFRNERSIYKRKCDAPGHTEEIISNYSAEKKQPVYDLKYWWSDAWDPLAYRMDYDFKRPFFEQFKELSEKVPVPALVIFNAVNSDYCNFTTDNKNCYLVFGGDFNEDCMYSTFNFYSKDTSDAYFVNKCELCYELVDSESCYKVRYGRYAENCSDCMFVYDCYGCTNCIGCVGLRNKSYHILNQPYSKTEYAAKAAELNLGNRKSRENFRKEVEELRLKQPHRYAHVFKSVNVSGDNITNAKNCRDAFDISGPAENLHHILLAGWDIKDARNTDHAGHKSELLYEGLALVAASRVFYSIMTSIAQSVYYSWNCRSSHDLFGCVNLRNSQYCILNKHYSKEGYEALVPKIIEHMKTTGEWGEFFPPRVSPFAYNETVAREYFPLSRTDVIAFGSGWKDEEAHEHAATVQPETLPDAIGEVSDSILQETIACAHRGKCNEHCTTAFRLTPPELQLYRRLNVPLPQLCSSCRHYGRFRQRNPISLWTRQCQCLGKQSTSREGQIAKGKGQIVHKNTTDHFHGGSPCPNTFKTSYAPDRPEIVYCEQCYNSEVV